jgi:hypothetical protein
MALCTCNFVQIKIDLSSCLRHPFGYVLSYALKLRMVSSLLADSFL